MFESKINRGRANGYAPLNGDGKVGLNYLPDVVGGAGTSGTSGINGINGSQGSSGASGTNGLNGTNGSDGTSGTSGTSPFEGVNTGSFATTGSNIFRGNQSIAGNLNLSGSLNISSSLTISSTVVNNGTINALNSDLIIEGGDIILSSSNIPTNLTGSLGDINGTIKIDNNSIYYCSGSFVPETYQIIVNQGMPYPTHVSIPKNQPEVPNLYSNGFSIRTPDNTTYVLTGVYSDGDNWDCEINNLNIEYFGGTQTMTLTWLDYEPTNIWTKTDFGFERGKFATTGSNTFNGEQTISGSLFVSGSSEFGGDLVPLFARGATLGTNLRPFKGIFVSSGSLNIASDVIGDPNTSISNVGGNLLISAGGIRLIGDASFVAATGSFQYLSGSFTHIGLQFNEGDIVTTGSLNVSGSTIQIGNNTQIGNNILSGSTTQIGNNTLIGITSITGSLFVSGSQSLLGTQILRGNKIVTGSISISGSQTFIGDQTLVGNKTITGSLNVNGPIYKDGNKQFNYGQWASLQTQTGSANTAYAMKLDTQTDGLSGFYVGYNVSGFPTRIYAQNTGLYNLQFSAQLHTTTNEAVDFSVWFAMTGSNIANSNTDFSIEKVSGGGFQVAALNFLTPITSGSYVELYWSKTTANGQLQAKGTQVSPTRPATPSLIVTVTQVA